MLTVILGNGSILLSFAFVPTLRTSSNYLLFGLALTDLGVGLVVHRLYIFVLVNVYNNSVSHCIVMAVYSIATSYLAGVSLLYLTIIGVDRYLAIRLHLRYQELVTEKRTNVTQIALWLVNPFLGLVWMKGFHVYSTFAAVVVAISVLVTFSVYVKVYLVVKRHRTQIHNQIESQMQLESCRLKRLRKPAINTLYVIFVFLLCYLPFLLTTGITNTSSSPNKIGVTVYQFSETLMLSNSSLNPLMYCLRLREFRSAVRRTYPKIFCWDSIEE